VIVPCKENQTPWKTLGLNANIIKYFVLYLDDPTTYNQTLNSLTSTEWKLVIEKEFNSLMKNNTWTFMPLLSNYNLVGCKWVFKTKYGNINAIFNQKVHLVIKDFSQQEGVDYDDKYSLFSKHFHCRSSLLI
jgi:histone deacetylase 1/2